MSGSRKPYLARLTPEGWRKDHQEQPALHLGTASQDTPDQSVSLNKSHSAWARPLAKAYKVDLAGGSWPRSGQREPLARYPLRFPVRILAVITDPQQVLRILRPLTPGSPGHAKEMSPCLSRGLSGPMPNMILQGGFIEKLKRSQGCEGAGTPGRSRGSRRGRLCA